MRQFWSPLPALGVLVAVGAAVSGISIWLIHPKPKAGMVWRLRIEAPLTIDMGHQSLSFGDEETFYLEDEPLFHDGTVEFNDRGRSYRMPAAQAYVEQISVAQQDAEMAVRSDQ